MTKILAIDQGTTSSRAMVFDAGGNVLHIAQKELALSYPQNGWVEQDPQDILRDVDECLRDCIRHHPDVVAIGITNQRETTILWDRETGKALYPAIVWQDRRTADYCEHLKKQGKEDLVRARTGLLLDPYFSATKIRWVLDHVDRAFESVSQGKILFGTVDSFLLWHLTGGKSHMTDVTNASRTMLFDIQHLCWDQELLDLFAIPRSILPQVKENVASFGVVDIDGKSYPVTGMAGDQQAALIGQACFRTGMMKSTYGTGCFALMNIGQTPKISGHQLLTSVGYVIGGQKAYVLEGAIFVAGAAIQWLRDELQFFDDASLSENLSQSVDDTNGVYFVPAFTGLAAPYWRADVRGAIFGLTRDTTRAQITRAALEAQAYQTCDLMGAMMADSGIQPSVLRVDGGLTRNSFMVQYLSDMLGIEVDVPQSVETTALGAAYLAGIGAGVYRDLDEVSSHWAKARSFHPEISQAIRDTRYQGWKKAVERLL